MSAPPTNRRALVTVACLGMLTFGIVLTALGAVLPSLVERFGLDRGSASALFPVLTFGILLGSIVVGPVVDRWGYRGILAASVALIVAALEGIAFAPSVAWLRAAIAAIGLAGGIVNSGCNTLVADVSEEGRGAGISFVGVFFGVGAVSVPFALGVLLDRFSFATIVAASGALVLVPLAAIAITRFPAPKHAQGFPLARAGALLRDPVLLLFGVMLFLASGMEITVGGWSSTYFQEELGIAGQRALVYLSLYWLGMMVARLALGWLLRRGGGVRVLLGCMGTALVGALLLVGTRSAAAAAAGVFLLGAGFSASFPVVLGFVGDRYARLSGTAFSVVMVMALVGGMVLPWATGMLGATFGLRGSFLVIPAAVVLLAALLAAVAPRVAAQPRTA